MAEKVPHPVPARRAEGRTKTRLVPGPLRAPVVLQVFKWRASERLGYGAIADRLNADPDRYPVPVSRDTARQREAWGRSSVREVLTNPKYTGYMVWNRRAIKKGGKVNPPSQWVWSPEPTHEPLAAKGLFEAAGQVAERRERSRDGGDANTAHPDTKRAYLLRSFVVCGMCGRRMFAKARKHSTYYVCVPALNHAGKVAERVPEGRGDRFGSVPLQNPLITCPLCNVVLGSAPGRWSAGCRTVGLSYAGCAPHYCNA